MATYNVTGVGGTTGHPSNGRTPYLVENKLTYQQLMEIQDQHKMMYLNASMFLQKH